MTSQAANNPHATAVRNTLTGERSTQQVIYPLTGDPELDAASGVMQVIGAHFPTSETNCVERIGKLLGYLSQRYLDLARTQKEQQNHWQWAQQVAHGLQPAPPPKPHIYSSNVIGQISQGLQAETPMGAPSDEPIYKSLTHFPEP